MSKLKLAGFKTFVDPTTVHTPGSLVGVVGPNGCGKSNIIDAVRWVLGETRASALRGDSMQDVIFNGSTTRKPVSRASVELVFDNAEGRAAGQWSQYAEISVKRVLERSGESSYHINGVHVRRKDVIDLFLGTGLGPRAYAIIEQGMISRIIEARPEEVRFFLEEAAGVTKYRERRRETEHRLSDAGDNLARLDDIRNELGERIVHLQAQAEVAARYKQLVAQQQERQHLLWLFKREEAQAEYQRLEAELGEAGRQLEADNARLAELEHELEAARQAQFAASEAVHGAQAGLMAASTELSRLEAERRHRLDTLARLEARLAQLDIERADWLARQARLQEDQARWEELAEHADLRAEQAEARHEEVAARLPDAEEAFRLAQATVNAVQRELSRTEQQLRVEEARRASAQRALDTLQERRARLAAEQDRIERPDPAAIESREMRVAQLEETLAVRQEELAGIEQALPEHQQRLRAALEAERSAQRRQTELRARHDALVALQKKLRAEGKLGDWLKRHELAELTPLWAGLRVEPGWELALEAVLRERLAALDLASHDPGAWSETLARVPPESLAFRWRAEPAARPPIELPQALAGLTPLVARLETAEPSLAAMLADWLHGHLSVPALDPWLSRCAELPPGVVLVAPDGRWLRRDSLGHFRPDARTHGVLERQREIETLEAALDEAAAVAEEAHAALQVAEEATRALQGRAGALHQDMQAMQQRLHAEQVELLKLNQALQRAEERSRQLGHDLAELAQASEAEIRHLEAAGREVARCAELAELQQAQLDNALDASRQREQQLREARALEQGCVRELQEARFSARECRTKLEELARNRALADEQLSRIADELAQRQAEFEACRAQDDGAALQQALELRNARERALSVCRDTLAAAAERVRELETLRHETERRASPLRDRVAELRLAAQAAELARAQFAGRLAEAGVDEAALRPLLDAELSETRLQRELGRLAREIGELGAVNLAALDELEAAATRKRYLDEQWEDLSVAIGTLEDAIRRIDRETRQQLQHTYDSVNRQFGLLFPQLFGGGQARLILTGDEILDAGIQIVAQPPGKKNSSIHLLSGGEKALTAIALVFSLFQLNPAPFCMLDEVDAPLDDSNTERFCNLVKRMAAQTQFLFISHSKITMQIAEQLVGVTMQEQGVSRVVEVDMEQALRLAEPSAA